MTSAGYIYVLLNPSIPGCVKIGKTTREPSQRATELSASTGVATPFLVAYEAYFQNCHNAENYIHALLERAGARLAENREFFVMDATAAINAVIEAKNEIDDDAGDGASKLAAVHEKTDSSLKPWEEVMNEALNYHHGLNGQLEDEEKAKQLYRTAAKLGAGEAYLQLGLIYCGKEGMDWLSRGADKGVPECWLELAGAFSGDSVYFSDIPQNKENALKALYNFLDTVDPNEFDSTGNVLYQILLKFLRLESEIYRKHPHHDQIVRSFISRFRSSLDEIGDAADRAGKLAAIDRLGLG